MTIHQFLEQVPVKFQAIRVDHNPQIDPDAWSADARHWLCKIKHNGRRMSLYFSQGSALTDDPTAADVLDCLASDASGIDESFQSWAGEFGYSPDSIKALKIYQTIRRQAKRLENVLGRDNFLILRDDTDRL